MRARVTMRPTLAWEQVGLARAAREVDVLLTWTERLPVVGSGRFVVWLFEPPTHRVEQNRRVGARAWQRGSDAVTSALWKRSLRRARVVLTGSQATADAIAEVAPARPLYPGSTRASSRAARRTDSRAPRRLRRSSGRLRHGRRRGTRGGTRARPGRGRLAARPRVGRRARARATGGPVCSSTRASTRASATRCSRRWRAGRPSSRRTRRRSRRSSATPGCSARRATSTRSPRRSGVLRDEEGLAAELTWRGLARAAEFTWERTARELAAAVEEAAA